MLTTVLGRLADLQTRRPLWVIGLAIATLLPTGWAASTLTLRTSFTELLPDSKPSVIEMRRVSQRLPGNSTLTVVAEGERRDALVKFVDALGPRLRALGPDLVLGVDDGPRGLQAFFERHKHLYADVQDLRELKSEIDEAYDAQVSKAAGMDLGLDDEEPKKISVDSVVHKLERKAEEAKRSSPGSDGYFLSKDGKMAVLLVRTPFGTADQRAFALVDRVKRLIDEVNPKQWDPAMRFGFTGNLITSAEQQRAITTDLTEVGIWGAVLILGAVFLFFLQVRTLLVLAITIAVGCVWAFGVASYTVGYLNTATGFLTSIIVGNGINFSIIYMARYIEARRDEGLGVDASIRVAHNGTWAGTLSAAGAAGIAYGSLSITDFRGFKHFGIIGGSGMLLCWVATYALLPALLVVTERISPMFVPGKDDFRKRFAALYGRPFAWLASRFPRQIAAIGVVVGIASVALAARYLSADQMEYNLRNIRNQDTGPTPARLLGERVDKIVGRQGQDGRAILVQRLDQVPPLVHELERRRDLALPDEKPFSKVVSVYSLLPDHQEEKLALLSAIKTRVTKARKRGFINDPDWARLEPHIPVELAPLGVEALPEDLVRPFSERDGTRGRVVYIVPTEKKSVYDARYLRRWADSFREVRLPNGEIVRGSGDPVIFTDMLTAIREEAPKAVTLSFLGTLAVILVSFRGRRPAWLALGALLLGLVWLVAFLAIKEVKINFLNFVALPIAIGIGADYALNVMSRRETDDGASVERVIVETGGAVMLCSLTTTLGYLALLLSVNKAVTSFGMVAAAGEVATMVSSVLVLPSVLMWRKRGTPASS